MAHLNVSTNLSVAPALVPGFFASAECMSSRPSVFVLPAFYVTHAVCLLPMCARIIHHGVRRRGLAAPSPASHSEVLTYHMVGVELVGVLSCFFSVSVAAGGAHRGALLMLRDALTAFFWLGETCFHLLTCVDRYLAVVHPLAYRGLRGERGVRGRDAALLCAWLLCAALTALMLAVSFSINLLLLALSLSVISFCSVRVLWALVRPRPGGGGERADPAKRRAFHTIAAVWAALTARLALGMALNLLSSLAGARVCLILSATLWLNLPSSLLLPLLFLLRVRRSKAAGAGEHSNT